MASSTFDRELDYTLEESAEAVLRRIEAALRRIESGTYGICERCGKEIGEERLAARPWASLCVDCQRLEDHQA
jgi:RNA polymerase-binding protein DksA